MLQDVSGIENISMACNDHCKAAARDDVVSMRVLYHYVQQNRIVLKRENVY